MSRNFTNALSGVCLDENVGRGQDLAQVNEIIDAVDDMEPFTANLFQRDNLF